MTEYRTVYYDLTKNCLPTQTITKIIKKFVPESQSPWKQECHTIGHSFYVLWYYLHDILFSTVKRYFSVSIEDLFSGEKNTYNIHTFQAKNFEFEYLFLNI